MTTETATPNQADASTAFLRAARAGQIEKIINLLEQGVDINVSNANGLNAIHLASKDGHVEVVCELLQRGAAIDAATKKGNTALHIASLAGQEAVVKLLVQNGAQVNIQSQNGFTPLYMAAQENHDGVVKFLLANGANQSLATEDGFTPLAVAMQQGHEKVVAVLLEADTRGRVRLPALHIAAKKDDVKAANLLLENEHNPDVTSKSGFTPLHIAAHYGNESVARLLLAKGADVNCAAKHNICPLHVAAKWGKDNMVSLLCDNGANVEARTRDGLTPLHCAARSGHERVVEALLDRGAPITSKSKNGLAPLHMAAQGDHSEAARVLLSRRAPVDDVTVDYLTALHVAAHCGHAKVAKLLLDRNADANARALNGFTPLHIACKKNRIKVVELLLKYGASIQATTESGLTPLHVASFMGCMNIVIYLLQHEANPDVPTVRGETPLHLAARANQTDIIRILLRNGAAVEAKARERQTPLHIASRLGNVDIAVLLLQHGADVRAMTADHYNALHIAAKQHNHDVAAALIEHNAPLTATTKKGFTALHLAAKYGNLKVANLLLAHGASPDQAGKNGMTPLHVAAQYDQQAVANTLLEKGADAKAIAKNGHTPLHIASRKNQMETAATLLEYGALTNAESKAGFTPLHLAAQQGHTEMCSLLLEHGADAGQQSKNGLAALHLAAQEDRVPVAQLLLKNGAEVDICTKGGYTPLHIASHYGQANMVRYLLENGASVKAETTHGYTALHHAAQQGHINIVNILLEHKADANATTTNGQTPLDIASKLGYVTVMETLKEVSEPSIAPASQDKYKVVAPETMLETFMSDSEEEGGEDTILNDQPYRYLTADDMKSLGDDSLPIDVTKDERTESAMSHKNIMEISQGSVNGMPYQTQEVVVKSVSRYSAAPEGYCYNVDPTLPNFLVSFLVDARGGALRGCRGGGVRVIVPPLSAQQPTRITCRYLKPSRINHMPPLMEGEALASRVLEMGPVSAKFLGPVILEVPHYASLRGKEREIVILRSDNGTSWREHNADATDDVVQDILHETLEIEEPNEDEKSWDAPRVTRILTHDFPQYFAVISRIRQEVHAIGPEGGMVSSSVVPQVQAVFPQGALTKKIKVGLQAQIIDSELTAKLLGRGVAVSPVVTVEPRRRKFHKAITLSMPAPRPHTQGMTNQYSTSSAPTLRLLCSISGGTNRAHWEDVTENTPLTFVNDCVSFTTTVSARYWLIDCRHVEDATKMATELYREAIHVPFMSRFVVYAKRTDECQAQLRMFCVTDDKEDKALERIERFIQVAKSRDVEVHEGKPVYLEFGGNLVPVAKSGEQLSIPFRAFRENRVAFPVMIKTQDLEPICRCQFMRDPKVPKGEPSPTPIAILNIMVPDDLPVERISPVPIDMMPRRTEEQELIWRQRLSDPRLEDICNLLGKDWVALAYELGVSVATVNQIQAKRITAAEQAQLMLKLWKTQSGTKAHDNSIELALCRIGRDDIIAPQSELINERRIQRNIYQERQASEEIEAYKAEEDNKLKESTYDDSEIAEHSRTEDLDQDEAKYSPEEKSILDKSEMDRTPTPSEESEEDEDVKRSVAERKEQITKKLSSSKIPASKQKKELREEIIEIKTQIKPDIKKFQDIEQQVKAEPRQEHVKAKQTVHTAPERETEIHRETVLKEKTEDTKVERTDQFRKYDPSSPAKPTPKHLQRHMRNESMRFPSGDFSNVTITPKKSITIETETKQTTEIKIEACTKESISQKEIDNARVEEKLDDGESSPGLVFDSQKDIAEATLKDKIIAYETKIIREPAIDTTKPVKLTKEALRRHTQEQDQGIEYTQAFVREQSKQIENQKIIAETQSNVDTVKSVKETIQHFDSKTKFEDKTKMFPKTMRTDSTLVQVSSEEDSEFLKKSTDSETETESQTTVKADKNKKSKFEQSKQTFVKTEYHETVITSTVKEDDKKQHDKDKKLDDKKKDDDSISIKEPKIEKQTSEELRLKVCEEEPTELIEERDVTMEEKIKEKAELQPSMTSTKSDLSKHTKTDSLVSETQEMTGHKLSQESTLPSTIDKTDSLADLQQSTEKDVSFVSQTESKVYSKESKHRSDSLDETSQFSDLDDQMGMSPAHKPLSEKPIMEEVLQSEESTLKIAKEETIKFLNFETEHSSQVHSSTVSTKEQEKISPVISAKARQFIETVPEDDSVQECFFSKRIYSDSLEESDHTDSRRHSEADSLKSDQSDIKAKISSSDFDERAEYEETVDSGSGFGDEKFEESIGFTIKIDPKVLESTKQDSGDSGSPQTEESDIVFKKMTPKRHSRTESVSISKLSDLSEIIPVSKQEFQMIVTEAEEIDRLSDKEEASDKISSESSREIEISDRKSSEGISDRISSEDAVTDKKTSSEEEHVIKEEKLEKYLIESTTVEKIVKGTEKVEITQVKGEPLGKDNITKRQSVTSVGSGSVSELRLDEKRLSDAHSITESRDYTFEESEDDIGTQGTHVDIHRERVESSQDIETKVKSPAKTETSKIAKLSHGDSLDDVEGFPEDHVMDYVPKLPHIAEVSTLPDKKITSQFLTREREEQLKRELLIQDKKGVENVTTVLTQSEKKELATYKADSSQMTDDKLPVKTEVELFQEKSLFSKDTKIKKIPTPTEETIFSDNITLDDKVSSTTETKIGDSGENINITTMIQIKEGTLGDKIIKTTITETTTYPSGEEHVSIKVSERVESTDDQMISSKKTAETEKETKYSEMTEEEKNIIDESIVSPDNKTISSQTETIIGETGERISTTTVVEQTITPMGEEITKTTVTETTIYPTGEEKTTTRVSESSRFLEKRVSTKDDQLSQEQHKPLIEKSGEEEMTTTLTKSLKTIETKGLQQPSSEDLILKTTSESPTLQTDKHYTFVEPESSLEDRLHMMLIKSDESEYDENKISSTDVLTEIAPNGEEIKRTLITETIHSPSGEERVRTTVTEITKNTSGEETISTRVSELVKSTQHTEPLITPCTEQQAKSIELEGKEVKSSTTKTETEIGPDGEQIKRTILTETTKYPSGEERIKTTITEKTKYLSGEETVSTRVSESVMSIEHTEVQISKSQETAKPTASDVIEDGEGKLFTTETETEIGPNGEEITRTIVTETTRYPSGEERIKTTITEKTKYPSGEETISTRVSESVKSIQQTEVQISKLQETEKPTASDELEDGEGKLSTTETETEIGPNGEEITRTIVTETTRYPSGEERIKTTITEKTKYPSGEETISTRVSESVKSIQQTEVQISKLQETEKPTASDELEDGEGKLSTTETETEIGPNGEKITRIIVTETTRYPSGKERIKTTITEKTKYPSGEETISTRVSESVKSIQHTEVQISKLQETEKPTASDAIEDGEGKLSTTETETEIGPNGEEITRTIVTETSRYPSGEEQIKTTITEKTKYPSGEETISTRVSESMKSIQQQTVMSQETDKYLIDKIKHKSVVFKSDKSEEKFSELDMKQEDIKEVAIPVLKSSITAATTEDKHEKFIVSETSTSIQEPIDFKVSTSKFDISKIRTDTLSQFDLEIDTDKTIPTDSKVSDTKEFTKEHVTRVIDDILQKGTTVATTKSPIHEKDVKIISKEILETERRSYDTKVPQKEERRHSCISPAISLERIAESEIEMEEEASKLAIDTMKSPPTSHAKESQIEMKKSDSAMKQMADNIEIIIKQASEDLDASSEEAVFEEEKSKDLHGEVSVDSIIEEALHTVEDYLVQSKVVEDEHRMEKKETTQVFEDTKISKERPSLMKSLSRDSGEVAIMPKKKQSRTFSVQSSPDEVEEQIYTDSESDMDKAKVLEIIEPTSDIDGKLPTSSFDLKKIKTDSLDDADDFPEKEVEYFEDEGKFPGDSESEKLKDKQFQMHPGTSSSTQPGFDDDKFSETYVKKTHFVDSVLRSDIVSKSTTESSLTTVISTLTKSSDDDQKSVLEDGTSADLSKISGADLVKDPSKTSIDAKEESRIEDQTDDLSKKSIDLTKDYSKSSIDSKDTSRDFATNELSKDSTVDLTKDFSKVSIDSVRETSRSLDEKTFSEEHSSFDVSKTLASDASDIIAKGKELIEEEMSILRAVSSTASFTQEQSVTNESKLYSEHPKLTEATEPEIEKDATDEVTDKKFKRESVEDEKKEEKGDSKVSEKDEESDVPDIKELNRRCSNLLEDISAQGALIRIDSSHVSHDLSSKFSKTPPPSPVDLIMKEKVKREETVLIDKPTGLQPKGSDSSFLDANRQSPRASSAGDSLTSETEAHQSEILTEASKALSAAATPKSPTKHIAENITFVNVDKPTITVGAQELVDRTIERSMDVIDQIKKEMHEEKQTSSVSDTFYSQSKIETSTSSSSIQKTIEGSQLKFQSIDPEAVMSDMIAKFGATSEYSTVLSHKETETRKISGQEYFSETKQVSSSDDDSLIIKTETSHELRGQEHEMKEKTTVRRDGDQTETSQKKTEKAHEATAKRSDVETKTVFKSTDDTDIVKIEREFSEQGLYSGRQTKSEERMTALKDETIKKKQEVKISERDLSHEQWGKEYFTESAELEDIKEDNCKTRVAFVDSNLKIVEKDETLCSVEVSEKGQIISSKVEHHKEESIIESKEHDDLSSDASHVPSFKSETMERQDSSETSPKSKSRSFKKEDEVYEVDFIKEIKISTSPVKSTFSRTGSQDTHSESEILPELPHDDKTSDMPHKEKSFKCPVKLPQSEMENLMLEVSIQKDISSTSEKTSPSKPLEITAVTTSTTLTMSSDTVIEIKETVDTKADFSLKTSKIDTSPSTQEITDDLSTTSKDAMIKSGESIDTEYMVKSLESHEGEVLQKSMDSTVSAETLHPSEFSNEADSAFITGSDQKKEGLKLLKEKSTEDICSSGYDTDFSSAEFHGMKLETERVALDSLMSAQPLADLSVLEKTIDEVKQSLEAAQGEIISEKSDGSIKYKQSPSEFQFKILLSPDRPEVIKEEPTIAENIMVKTAVTDESKETIIDYDTESISQKNYSQEEISISDEERGTVQLKESSPPLEADISIRSDSGPHSILETESDLVLSDRNDSSKGSPEVKLRVQKHLKSHLGVTDRRSASEIEGWSSSGESHYHSFEHSESRPLSSDIEVMMTAQSGTDYETALTSQDISSHSLRTSKDYFTAGSSLASRDSMRSLDSDASSHVASIDISDASETLVPSANELKEELMESSTYVEQFLHAQEKGETTKTKEVSDEEISGDEEYKSDAIGSVGKMKRSHEMRFQPKDMIPEHFPIDGTSESIELDDDSLKDKDGSDTTISSQLKTDELLSSSISKVEISTSQVDSEKEEIKENITKASVHHQEALPFSVTKVEKTQRQFVDVESEIIPIGSAEYEQIQTFGTITTHPKSSNDEIIVKTVVKMDETTPLSQIIQSETEIREEFVKKEVQEIAAVPFPITEKPPRQREFVDIEADIIPEGTKQYEEILKSKSDSSVPKTKVEKSGMTSEVYLESKQSSTSSLKTHEHLSTPQTPLSAPSQSSLSTDNGREYVLDDMYDISETPELKSDLHTVSSRSELVVTTEERALQTYEKEQESPTSDEFEMVDKPSEMDDFVVIEEVAKEAQETDPEGKSLQIKSQVYVKRHDTEVEEYLSKTSKKQESTSSASGSLSDEELQLYEMEQKRIQAQELAEIEAGKRWIQMQFEGDPRYDFERIPLEDIKEEEMTDFDNSRIGSLSSQKESIGSFGSFRNSYGSLSESEMASRMRFRLKGENDDISISSLQEFENLERALMEQYNQHSSSQDSLNGSLPRRYILSRSQGDDISVSSLKEFEGLETACLEALKAELIAKQKEALLLADPKVVSGSFLEQEKRSYDSSSESSPPLKSSGSPGQKSGSPSQKSGSPSQKIGSYGSPSQRLLADSAAIRKLIDQQLALEQRMQESRPKVVVVKKTDEKGSFFVPEPVPGTSGDKTCEVEEECKKVSTFTCAAAPSDGSAESIPGDCEEMMKILDQEEQSKAQIDQRETQQSEGGVIEIVRTTTVIQQKFVDGKKVSETIKSLDGEGGIDIPSKPKQIDDNTMSFSSEMSSSLASQPSEMDSLMTIIERYPSETEIVTYTKHTIITSEKHEDKQEDFDFSREGSAVRELSPSSGRSIAHSTVSGKHFTDPASGSWSGQDEELSSSGSFSRARADLMLGSTDSLEATSSNATRATYNYEVDTPMTGSLTSGAFRFAKLDTNQRDNIARPPGSNTMVSSLDTLDPVTAVQMESLEHQSTSEHYSQDYEVHEPDSDTERLELDGRIPQAKERTIMFDSTDTLSAVSGDGSVREAAVEAPAPTFYIGDTPILKGEKKEDQEDSQTSLSGSCPAALPPATQSSPPVPAQRRSLSMIPKPTSSNKTKK